MNNKNALIQKKLSIYIDNDMTPKMRTIQANVLQIRGRGKNSKRIKVTSTKIIIYGIHYYWDEKEESVIVNQVQTKNN